MNVPQLRFKEFSEPWDYTKLIDIFPYIRNGFVGIATPFYVQDGIKYLQGKNIKNGLVDPAGLVYVNQEFHSRHPNSALKVNDIVMVQSGHVGQCAVIEAEYENANCHALIILSPADSSKTSSHFFCQYFGSTFGKRLIYGIKTGNTIQHVLASEIKELQPFFPKFKEQQKIASFLSKIDQKISLLTKKNELLIQYKKGVMQKIFNQEIRFKDRVGENFPEWEYFSGDEIFKSVNNRNHNSELPILSATQDRGMYPRSENGIDIISSEKSVSSYKVINRGDYVISLRSFQGGIEYSEYDGISSPAYTVLKPTKEISDNFFRAYFKKDSFISQLNGTVVGIRDGKQISFSAFSTLELPYPCIKEQELIANFLSLIDKKIALCNGELIATKQYKQGLLQQMFI